MAETMMAPPQTPAATPTPSRPRRVHFSVWDRVMRFSDIGLGVWSIIMFIFLYLPIVVLVIFSFNDQKLNVVLDALHDEVVLGEEHRRRASRCSTIPTSSTPS